MEKQKEQVPGSMGKPDTAGSVNSKGTTGRLPSESTPNVPPSEERASRPVSSGVGGSLHDSHSGIGRGSPSLGPRDKRTPLELATEVTDPELKRRDEIEKRKRAGHDTISIDFEGYAVIEQVDDGDSRPRTERILGPWKGSLPEGGLFIRRLTNEESREMVEEVRKHRPDLIKP